MTACRPRHLFAFLSRNWGFLVLVNRSAGGNDSVWYPSRLPFYFLAAEDFDIHTEEHTLGVLSVCVQVLSRRVNLVCACVCMFRRFAFLL
jgi:hypothetical protein